MKTTKKATINISFEDEKLSATRNYMSKKNADLNEKLVEFIQKLYEKYVPSSVQEYITEREINDVSKTNVKRKRISESERIII